MTGMVTKTTDLDEDEEAFCAGSLFQRKADPFSLRHGLAVSGGSGHPTSYQSSADEPNSNAGGR